METQAQPVITVHDLEFGYGHSNQLKINELTIRRGAFLGVLGPNGAGKSTLLRLMAGLLPPRRGQIRVFGRPLDSHSPLDRASQLAWVPQRLETPFDWTVEEMVGMGRYPHSGQSFRTLCVDRVAVARALDRVGLAALAGRELHQLSGGEWQRAVIARALAQDAPILILDEPVANLDLRYQREIYELLGQLAREGKGAVIAADHHVDLQSHFCDRVLLLHEGSVVAEGRPLDVMTQAGLERAFRTAVRVELEQGRPRVFWRFGSGDDRGAGT